MHDIIISPAMEKVPHYKKERSVRFTAQKKQSALKMYEYHTNMMYTTLQFDS